MFGKFDSTVYFEHGRKTLDVCGPIFWDPADAGMDIRVEIKVFQSGNAVRGQSPVTFQPPDPEWMVYLSTNALHPGTAFGTAQAIDTNANHVVATWNGGFTIDRHATFLTVAKAVRSGDQDEALVLGEAPPPSEWQQIEAAAWDS